MHKENGVVARLLSENASVRDVAEVTWFAEFFTVFRHILFMIVDRNCSVILFLCIKIAVMSLICNRRLIYAV